MYDDFEFPMIKVSTTIDAPVAQVFEYLGNSENANQWSVFVDHISPLSGIDGEVGSFRRCFRDKAEKAEQWDEEIIINEPSKRRRLTVFNLQNFKIQSSGLLTEQIYESIENNRCRLSFTLFYNEESHTFWNLLKMHIFSYYIEYIFENNLERIRVFNEVV